MIGGGGGGGRSRGAGDPRYHADADDEAFSVSFKGLSATLMFDRRLKQMEAAF